MNEFVPTYWYRLFGLAKWKLRVVEHGIYIGSSLWAWGKLGRCSSHRGWFGWTLNIETPEQIKLRGASRTAVSAITALCATASTIQRSAARLDATLSSDKYISEFDRRELEKELVPELQRVRQSVSDAILKHAPVLKAKYEDVVAFLEKSRENVDRRNHEFVGREMVRLSDWFSEVERTPLTPEQMRAVIVMEDRNLLVAAAGSGKTSTIVAKAAYTVFKGYCSASEVLVLTFNRRVRQELMERLADRLKKMRLPTDVDVQTFNAFGLAQVRRLKKDVRVAPWASSQAKAIDHLKALTGNLIRRDPEFAAQLAEFSAVWLESDEKEREEITLTTSTGTFEQALALLLSREAPRGAVPKYTALAGHTVRSLQELRISNWLSLMGVQFVYEKSFPEAHVPQEWRSGYRPDFYYPEIDCWHEHFGINKLGKAPPWMNNVGSAKSRSYEDEVAAKRALLRSSSVQWFETTSADFEGGDWQERLKSELTSRGAKPNFIGWDNFIDQFQSMETANTAVIALILSCIQHAKSNRKSPQEVVRQLPLLGASRTRAFLEIFSQVYAEYETDLQTRGELDFEDMVIISADAFYDQALTHAYKLVLVDEFQDVSNSRAELITALLSVSPVIKLFGVGDDWQSIYRFAGADITAMTKFDERFGYTAKNYLTRTFRSNQDIADAASKFVMRNPNQLRKEVIAPEPGTDHSIEIVFHWGENSDVEYLDDELKALAKSLRERGERRSVYLLGRYNFLEPQDLEQWRSMYGDAINLTFLSIHKAKGLEADIVFLLGASNRKGQDFPSTIQDDPLLSLFMPVADAMPWAEERRLFYVALTRARHKVYILSPEGRASLFVAELLSSRKILRAMYSGGKRSPIIDAQPHLRLPQCPNCERGSVMKRVSQFGPFEFCTLQCGYKKNLTH